MIKKIKICKGKYNNGKPCKQKSTIIGYCMSHFEKNYVVKKDERKNTRKYL